jgi:tetratricopeptide (TPR) repeat protein
MYTFLKKITFTLTSIVVCAGAVYSQSVVSENNAATLEKQLNIKNPDTLQVQLLASLANEYINSEPEKGLGYAQKGLQLAQRIAYRKGSGLCLKQIGNYYMVKSNYVESLLFQQRALEEFQFARYDKGLASVYNNIANIYYNRSDFANALQNYLQSLNIKKRIGDRKGEANTLCNIGSMFLDYGDIKKGISYKQQSTRIYESIKDTGGIANSWLDMGIVYKRQNKFVQALQFLTKAATLHTRLHNQVELSLDYNNIGEVYDKQNHHEKALFYFQKALALQQLLGNGQGIAKSWLNIARVQRKNNQVAIGIDYAQKALKVFQEVGNRQEMCNTSQFLSEVWELQKNYPLALYFQREALVLRDSIFNQEKNQLINRMETNYALERREAEMEVLAKDRQLEAERSRSRQAWMIGWLVGISLIAGFLLLAYHQTRRLYLIQKIHALELDNQNHLLEEHKALAESANAELVCMNEKLDEKVAERTALLAEQNEKLTEYAFYVSHRLRSPVATVMGLIEVFDLVDTPEDNRQVREYLKLAARRLDEALHTINRLVADPAHGNTPHTDEFPSGNEGNTQYFSTSQ